MYRSLCTDLERERERERVREKERKLEDKYQLHNKYTLLDAVLTMIATAKAVWEPLKLKWFGNQFKCLKLKWFGNWFKCLV